VGCFSYLCRGRKKGGDGIGDIGWMMDDGGGDSDGREGMMVTVEMTVKEIITTS
jgi:hypothetical protein